jgi:hypothetical protein
MLPIPTMPDSKDCLWTNAVEPPDFWCWCPDARSNCQNISICKLRTAVSNPAQAMLAVLGDLICCVVGVRSEEQVRRIYAKLVVASMTDVQIVRDRSMEYLKRNAMGALRLLADHYLTIPLGRAGKPIPALILTSGRGLRQQPFFQSRLHPSGHERNLP